MRLGENDRQIIRWVYQFRILSQSQLERLMGRSRPTLQRLLRRLYDHRYLDRVFLPVAKNGSSPSFYILDAEGKALLRKMGVEDFTGLPSKKLSTMYLEHTTGINEVRLHLTLACQQQGWRITRWLTENEIKAAYDRVRVPGQLAMIALVPDSYFTIEVPEKGSTHFFLELDRGTMTTERFKTKVAAYTSYYSSGLYERRYKAKGFRVITVVDSRSSRRPDSLIRASQSVKGIGRRFWFARLGDLTPTNILSQPVWKLAGNEEKLPLFDIAT
jgi:DNA-binding MarR family transcriptional regulator